MSFDVESREYNGKWFTDVKAWKIESGNQRQPVQQEQKWPSNVPSVPTRGDGPKDDSDDATDDLPF